LPKSHFQEYTLDFSHKNTADGFTVKEPSDVIETKNFSSYRSTIGIKAKVYYVIVIFLDYYELRRRR